MSAVSKRLSTLRRVGQEDGWRTATDLVRDFGRTKLQDAAGAVNRSQVSLVDRSFGHDAGDSYFWNGVARRPGWREVQGRLEMLDSSGDAAANQHFVRTSLELTVDPVVVLGLAGHPLSQAAARDWIIEAWPKAEATLAQRFARQGMLAAAFASLARLLLDPAPAAEFIAWAEERSPYFDMRFRQFVDSVGWSISEGQRSTVAPTRHRYVIAEHLGDVDAMAPLLVGADRVSILATSDTFGRADFSKFLAFEGIGNVEVEHIRTRIPRFSAEYVEIHEATAAAAVDATAAITAVPGLVAADMVSILEVAVADFLFFQALKLRAIEVILSDPTVDEIVIAVGAHQTATEFLRLLTSADGLLSDPRVQVVSVSRSPTERSRFWKVVQALENGVLGVDRSLVSVDEPEIVDMFTRDTRRLSAEFCTPEALDRPTALLAAATSPSYLDSIEGYVESLREAADVRVMWFGSSDREFEDRLSAAGASLSGMLAPSGERFNPLSELVRIRLAGLLPGGTSPAERAARAALTLSSHRLGREAVGPILASGEALSHWLSACEERGDLPDVMLMCPQRTVWVAASAVVARRFMIPSIALEPHAQDANYSRYIKIGADHYGVLSDHFRHQVAGPFGLGADRVWTIGSPRQVAPRNLDRAEERRQALGTELDPRLDDGRLRLSFFCQPSAWSHVDRLWTSLLTAAREQNCVVLLKTHPEESISRSMMYLERAAALGESERVVCLDVDASAAIALSDVVITAYSAAGFDAMLRQCPVVVLTEGEIEYPVDLHAILGVPVARSTAELVAIIESHRTNPAYFSALIADFLEREPQFVEGPGPRLRELVAAVLEAGPSAVRERAELPDSLFLDGPHPIFPV